MADTLKFGPEWLRALSDGNSVGTPPPSPAGLAKYKLAEHRYGREEMLALFLPSTKMPDCLKEFPFIALEKAQIPLAVQPVTEEEQRIMSQSVNSAAAYRMTGRGIPPLRGRGGPDRGRGRGRGRGDGYIQRGLSYDDTDGFGRPRPARGEPWEEGGLKRFERRFEDSSAMSPRKEFTRSLSSDNWREKPEREMDEDGDWRRAGPRDKWGSRANWREAGRPVPEYDRSKPNGGPPERGGFERPQRVYRRSKSGETWEEEDMLPEWSVADSEDLDNVGTFDSSGAFVSKDAQRRRKDTQRPEGRGDNPPSREGEAEKQEHSNNTAEPLAPDEAQLESMESRCDTKTENSPGEPRSRVKTTSAPPGEPWSRVKTTSAPPGNFPQRKSQEMCSQASLVPPVSKGTESPTLASKNLTKSASSQSAKAPNCQRQKSAAQDDSAVSVVSGSKAQDKCDVNSNRTAAASNQSERNTPSEEDTLQRLEKAAVSMVTNVTDEEHEDRRNKRPTSSPKAEASGAPVDPVDPDLAQKWFYRDPQGKLQGPFASNEMAEWFSAGYFTMSLLVRRGCDERFQPLGELIKRWNRVPFLPGPAPPPLLNSPVNVPPPETQQQQQQEHLKLFQQQMLVQQQLLQQQFLARQLQMQTLMQQLQQQDGFSKLSPTQQQQLAVQLLLKQQHLLPDQQKLSPRSPPNEPAGGGQPAFQRSFSQPADHSQSQGEEPSVWGNPGAPGNWSQPSSVWDLDQPNPSEKARNEAEEMERLRRLAEAAEKRKKEEEIQRKQEELRSQQEELRRQQEEIQRQKEEIERQRLLEMQRVEEARRKEEEDRKKKQEEEEQRKIQEEIQRQHELQEQQRQQEIRQQALRQQQESQRQQELRQQQESQRQQELRQQQERERQQELERLKEAEWQRELQQQKEAELLNQRQLEMQRRQELQKQQEQQRQQKEALRRLQQQQQEQLANMQLPATANWVKQEPSGQAVSLAEIQQLQEQRQRKEEEIKRQTEAQRRQIAAIQEQAQPESKFWTKQLNFQPTQRASPKSLLEIQEEQARQLEIERQKKQSQQPVKANLPLGAATVWGNGSAPSSTWASEGAWGNAQKTSNPGFWDDPTPHLHTQPTKNNKKSAKTPDNNFPALGGKPAKSSSNKNTAKQTNKSTKTSRDEEAVQRLFRAVTPEDEFTQWCEKILKGMATSVDVPTFVAFLQEVESPYEIHDYVRSYLGETKASADFAKQFVEKRSYYKNKARQQQKEDEDSIWGPAPAVNPKESRPISSCGDSDSARNKNRKGKKKMQKLDASNLGFTVHAAPDRINVGQIESAE